MRQPERSLPPERLSLIDRYMTEAPPEPPRRRRRLEPPPAPGIEPEPVGPEPPEAAAVAAEPEPPAPVAEAAAPEAEPQSASEPLPIFRWLDPPPAAD